MVFALCLHYVWIGTHFYIPGEVELWIDGESVIYGNGLLLRASDKSIIKWMHFETFFGGQSSDLFKAYFRRFLKLVYRT